MTEFSMPARKRVVLMRHGEVRYFDVDGRLVDPRTVTLTENGRIQAAAAADMLAGYHFDRALCSSAPRTRETAAFILAGGEVPLQPLHELREIRGGRFSDVPSEDMDQVIGRAFDGAVRDEERFIGGELFVDFEARVLGAFKGWLLDRSGDETLLAVLHEGVNRLLLSWALTGGRAAMVGLEQDTGCVNVVDFDVVDGAIVRSLVRTVNVTPADPSKRARVATGMEEICATYRLHRTRHHQL
jgi:phosphoserine phosphatase